MHENAYKETSCRCRMHTTAFQNLIAIVYRMMHPDSSTPCLARRHLTSAAVGPLFQTARCEARWSMSADAAVAKPA